MGGERNDTCDHGLPRSWKVDVCEKNTKVSGATADSGILIILLGTPI